MLYFLNLTKIIDTEINSLNNRFLPYDVITTDAVVSLDDDIETNTRELGMLFR